MNKLKWIIKQILPLTYRTKYVDEKNRKHFVVWKMWFGRQFNIDNVIYLNKIRHE